MVAVLLAATLLVSVMPISPRPAAAQTPAVSINEFQTSNVSGITDSTGSREDWVELHNTSGSPVDLTGWTLVAGSSSLVFSGQSIPADGFLVVFASGDAARSTISEPHAPFKLDSGGEPLLLLDSNGALSSPSWLSAYPPQSADISYGLNGDGQLVFFEPPTPNAANSGGGLGGLVEPVSFSVLAGYKSSAQTVVLGTATPSASIRYTLDGSAPTSTNGTQIIPGASITVTETSVVRAVAYRNGWFTSAPETRTYLFASDIIAQPVSPPGWPQHRSVNDHYLDYEMDPDVVNGNELLIESSLRSLPTMSIVTDPDNLFDAATGIYVNPQERGSEWERPASIELIDPSGALLGFDINGGLRLRGGSSRSTQNPKHSLRLFFRDEYEGDLDYPLFGDEGVDRFERIDLRTVQHENWGWRPTNEATYVEDVWSRDTQAAMGQPYTRSRQVHLFLNGLYWGVYMTQERVTGDFGASYFGGSKDDYDVIKRSSPGVTTEASDGDLVAWNELYALVSDGVVTPAEYAEIATQVDLVNLADYYLLFFYSADFDGSPSWYLSWEGRRGGSNNWYAMRNRSGTGQAGTWQFFDHDSEVILCQNLNLQPLAASSIDNTTPWPMRPGAEHFTPATLHQALITNPVYRQVFADRTQLHMLDAGGALTIGQAQARYDQRVAEVDPAIDAESARWGDGNASRAVDIPGTSITVLGRSDWAGAVQIERTCMADRWAVTRDQLIEDGLWPQSDPVTISPAPGEIPFGSSISIDASGRPGTIWYSIDGADPLGTDGQPSPSALLYSGGVSMQSAMTVKARVFDGGAWSPLAEASFTLSAPPDPPKLLLNEFNAVGASSLLGGGLVGDLSNGTDSVLGRIVGNGGDWFELVVLEDRLDIRGWAIEVWDLDGGVLAQSARLVFGNDPLLADLRSGTLITVSEDIVDDVSYRPHDGDWHINLQANDAGDGAFFTAGSQSGFAINNDDTRVALFDGSGDPEALSTGEGTAPNATVGSTEVFKLETAPTGEIRPDSDSYNDGKSSTWGRANLFDGGSQQQDLSALRIQFGDPNCDGNETAADALVIAEFLVGTRNDSACPLANGVTGIFSLAGDVNDDGVTNVVDALLISQCAVAVTNVACP